VGDIKKWNGFLVIYFCKFSQTGILPTKTKNASRNKKKFKYFCTILLDFPVKTVMSIAGCRNVCAKFWILFSSISPDNNVWDLQWRQAFSITTTQLGDTAI
jgi:hypothetical protein